LNYEKEGNLDHRHYRSRDRSAGGDEEGGNAGKG
jgi:hypothetical protein